MCIAQYEVFVALDGCRDRVGRRDVIRFRAKKFVEVLSLGFIVLSIQYKFPAASRIISFWLISIHHVV